MKSMIRTITDCDRPLVQLANEFMKHDIMPQIQRGFGLLRFVVLVRDHVVVNARVPLVRYIASRAQYHDYVP